MRWIEAAILSPDARHPDPQRPGVTLSFKVISEYGGRILRVAHRQDGNDTKIITVHFDRGAKL
jgi:hypothetical protein